MEKCIDLGLLVNLEKSELEPKQLIVFLGDLFDFTRVLLLPTDELVAKIIKLCN